MKRILYMLFLLAIFSQKAQCQLNIEHWIYSGIDKYDKKDFSGAIADFNTIILFRPNFNDAYFFRGVCKFSLNDYRGAIEDFSQAINIPVFSFTNYYSTYSRYYFYRGYVKQFISNYKGAILDMDTAIDYNPDFQDAYSVRGFAYLRLGQNDKAIQDFDKLIWINKNNSDAYKYRGDAKSSKTQYDDALKDFNKAISINPDDADVYVYKGKTLAVMKNYKDAISNFTQAIQLDKNNLMAYFSRSLANLDLKNYKASLKDCDKILEIDPNHAKTYFLRANIRAELGDYNEALKDYNKVESINPNNIFNYFNRGILWLRLHQFRNAVDDNSTCINLNPNFALAYHNRAVAKEGLNDYDGSKLDFQLADRLNANADILLKSGKLDSTGLAQLTELDGDFDEGTVLGAKSKNQDIEPFSIFYIDYTKEVSPIGTDKIYQLFMPLNRDSLINAKFAIVNSDNILKSDSVVNNLLIPFESLPEKESNFAGLFARAILNHKLQRDQDAIHEYKRLLFIRPSWQVYFNLANTLYDNISSSETPEDYNNKIVYLGNNKFVSKPIKPKTSKNYDEVIEDYKNCIHLEPEFYYAYFNLGNVNLEDKEYFSAIENYTSAIEMDPKFSEAYYNRGLTYIYLKKKDEGCRDLSKAGELGVDKAYPVISKYCK